MCKSAWAVNLCCSVRWHATEVLCLFGYVICRAGDFRLGLESDFSHKNELCGIFYVLCGVCVGFPPGAPVSPPSKTWRLILLSVPLTNANFSFSSNFLCGNKPDLILIALNAKQLNIKHLNTKYGNVISFVDLWKHKYVNVDIKIDKY